MPAETWIFDLDNTLYPADCELFGQIDVRMGRYIGELLALDAGAARRLQKTYYRQHGTTLHGLMRHHGVDPQSFLDFVHDIDLSPLDALPSLRSALAALPGRRYVFTNGSRAHAERVLERLGIADMFAGLFDIAAAGYVPKPNGEAYDRLLERFAIAPLRAVFVEDSMANLAPAAERGMTTVWLRGANRAGAVAEYVDQVTDDLADWLRTASDGG